MIGGILFRVRLVEFTFVEDTGTEGTGTEMVCASWGGVMGMVRGVVVETFFVILLEWVEFSLVGG